MGFFREVELHSSFYLLVDNYICKPIFRLVGKNNLRIWNKDCYEAFEKIKYLVNPPLLIPPIPRKSLIQYLIVNEASMNDVLGQHNNMGRKKQVIYYINKKFTDCEEHYNIIKKLCCGLAWSAKRLR
jgi:hypothetical protein